MRHLIVISVFLACSFDAYAAGKINRYSGLSAEYSRSLNRYAATELDAAYYNPAGLVFGEKGFGFKVLGSPEARGGIIFEVWGSPEAWGRSGFEVSISPEATAESLVP